MNGKATVRARPRDRRAQILRTAAALFHEHGYHGVGVDGIAAAVGISGPALYKHFRGKHDLLWHVIDSGLAAYEAASPAGLGELLDAMVALALERRELGVLWQRESRNLNAPERAEFRARLRRGCEHTARLLAEERPELGEDEARLLSWAITAVVSSPSYHRASFEGYPALLRGMLAAVARSTAPVAAPPVPVPQEAPRERASRREAILAAAIHLFARHGFAAVSNDDIGAATGVTGPTVYKHFASKTEILVTALNRGDDALQLALDRALTGAPAPADALPAVVASYADFAAGHPDLIGVLITEVIHLPAEERHANRRKQHLYVAEWTRLLRAVRPELSQPEALALTHGALTLVNDLVRLPLTRSRPHRAEELTALALEVLRAQA
ncbi:AcrR family transcriptional regulator [Thermocatellispora tengchongensis]|uniref:AcrR family transcriptional regulator n=1 Tax=Thermocatellispora tengchongensis TaxID=1073253 RepID=A0A840P1F6_9ACTN|nr:TetR/AcrR family transcriptional regulator [Thermocatellispora tengchongensis]MBB5135094.1 AcrR family transcriptional regulator [Thermocatellispora tengchongensis]